MGERGRQLTGWNQDTFLRVGKAWIFFLTTLLHFVYIGCGAGASAMWIFCLPLIGLFMLGITFGVIFQSSAWSDRCISCSR